MLGATRRTVVLVREGAVRGYVAIVRSRFGRMATTLHLRSARMPEVVAKFTALEQLGISTTLVFAADEPGLMYLRSIGGNDFDRCVANGSVELINIEGGDHVFSPPAARDELVERLTALLAQRHPVSGHAGESTRTMA